MMELLEQVQAALSGRASAYRDTFINAQGDKVLKDLAAYCRANESTAHPDPNMAARLDGRREVWLRIQQHLRLTDDQLWSLFQPRGKS